MKHLLHGLERHGIGRRALTDNDFERICERENVDIFWSSKRYPFYFTVPEDDLKIIVLPKRLTGPQLLFAQYHELAHHFLHGGTEPCLAFLGQSDKKCEAEADAVALVSIFPRIDRPPTIASRFMQRLWENRLRLYFNYGI